VRDPLWLDFVSGLQCVRENAVAGTDLSFDCLFGGIFGLLCWSMIV
jgi:hypothetical protein